MRSIRHVSSQWTRRYWGVFVSTSLLFCILSASANAEISREYDVKLAYLLNFARYTTWKTIHADNAVHLCVVGDEELANRLKSVSEGRQINDKAVVVTKVSVLLDINPCDLLYFPRRISGTQLPDWFNTTLVQPMLSVGEEENFLNFGGDLRFVLEEGSVHFEVNLNNVRRSGLDLSSRLLQHAQKVVFDGVNAPDSGGPL